MSQTFAFNNKSISNSTKPVSATNEDIIALVKSFQLAVISKLDSMNLSINTKFEEFEQRINLLEQNLIARQEDTVRQISANTTTFSTRSNNSSEKNFIDKQITYEQYKEFEDLEEYIVPKLVELLDATPAVYKIGYI
jgi:transcriptional/translational regulatory protein YebC/TACO1